MRRAARVDGPHAAIVARCRQLGADVLDLSRVGGGCPDLLVGFRGQLHFVEVKASRGQLTADQARFHQRWKVHVLRTVDEVDALLFGRVLDGVSGRASCSSAVPSSSRARESIR